MQAGPESPGLPGASAAPDVRICFLVTLYKKFDQALRLVRRLDGPQTGFVFHIDAAVDDATVARFRAALPALNEVRFAERVRSRWATFQGAVAVFHCIDAALGMDPFDRYVLISGQDYPIASRARMNAFFRRHPDTEFMEAAPIDVADENAPGASPHYRFARYHLWFGARRKAIPLLRKRAPPIALFHGSTWWALTHDALRYLALQFRVNHAARRYFRHAFFVEEAYIQSLLMSSPFATRVARRSVVHDEWTPTSGPHPKVLTVADLAVLQESPRLFARKFDDEVDAAVMDVLDQWYALDARALPGAPA